jgi:ankyrin repeat protein
MRLAHPDTAVLFFRGASQGGNSDIVQFFFEKYKLTNPTTLDLPLQQCPEHCCLYCFRLWNWEKHNNDDILQYLELQNRSYFWCPSCFQYHDRRNDENIIRALDVAAQNGHLEIVQLLLSKSPKIHIHVAFVLAAENGHLDVVKFLWRYMAEHKRSVMSVALWFAARSGHSDVQMLLWDLGASLSYIQSESIIMPNALYWWHEDDLEVEHDQTKEMREKERGNNLSKGKRRRPKGVQKRAEWLRKRSTQMNQKWIKKERKYQNGKWWKRHLIE